MIWFFFGVNRQLPPEITSFVNYPFEINKTSISPLKLHNVNQFTPSVKFFLLVNNMFCKYPPKFCTYVQNAPELDFFFFYL